jgi:Major Facilitator Superfamily
MAGVATLPAAVIIAAAAPLTGRIVARRGSRMLMTAAGLFLGGGALVLTQDRVASSYLILEMGYVLLGFGFALINPPITNTAVGGMPTAQAGVASAIATSSRQLGNVLGVAIIGSAVTSQLRHSLGQRADTTRLAAPTRAALGHAGTGTSLRVASSLPGAAQADQILREAFTTASHTGWDLAAIAGLAIAAIAWLTTSARARATAAAMHKSLTRRVSPSTLSGTRRAVQPASRSVARGAALPGACR